MISFAGCDRAETCDQLKMYILYLFLIPVETIGLIQSANTWIGSRSSSGVYLLFKESGYRTLCGLRPHIHTHSSVCIVKDFFVVFLRYCIFQYKIGLGYRAITLGKMHMSADTLAASRCLSSLVVLVHLFSR